MPKKPRTPPRPRDVNQLAARIGQIATHEIEDNGPEPVNPAHQKRGDARAKSLSARRRKQIARGAAAARWKKKDK
jgi:hypothetical protein